MKSSYRRALAPALGALVWLCSRHIFFPLHVFLSFLKIFTSVLGKRETRTNRAGNHQNTFDTVMPLFQLNSH